MQNQLVKNANFEDIEHYKRYRNTLNKVKRSAMKQHYS